MSFLLGMRRLDYNGVLYSRYDPKSQYVSWKASKDDRQERMGNGSECLSTIFLEFLSCRMGGTLTVIFALVYAFTVTTTDIPWRSVVSDSMSLLLSIDCHCHLSALPSKGHGEE